MVLFFTHIPFVVNYTINATPPERLQQWQVTPDRQSGTVIQQQKLKTLRIGTWNVRTLFQNGKLDDVIQEMERIKIVTLGIAEVRWTQKGIF